MGKPKAVTPTDAGSNDWTTVDLSTGTETNTGQRGTGNSLGTSSTIVCAAVHGGLDGGLDGYHVMVDLSEDPTSTSHKGIELELACDYQSTSPSGGKSGLYMVVGGVAVAASNEMYYGGVSKKTGGDLDQTTVARSGSNTSSGQTMTGAVTMRLISWFDGLRVNQGSMYVAGATTGIGTDSETAALVGTPSTTWIGVAVNQSSASPSQALTWSSVILRYRWID